MSVFPSEDYFQGVVGIALPEAKAGQSWSFCSRPGGTLEVESAWHKCSKEPQGDRWEPRHSPSYQLTQAALEPHIYSPNLVQDAYHVSLHLKLRPLQLQN